jgi:uncharacterized protein (DUF952 family)
VYQVEHTGARVYGDTSDLLVVLVIDPKRVKSPVKVEGRDSGIEELPHIYGPLPTRAVVDGLPVVRSAGAGSSSKAWSPTPDRL